MRSILTTGLLCLALLHSFAQFTLGIRKASEPATKPLEAKDLCAGLNQIPDTGSLCSITLLVQKAWDPLSGQLAIGSFMDRVGEDHRISPTHISLFLGILYFYRKQEYSMPIYVNRKELMRQSKISAFGTYHRAMRDLKLYGYIGYVPSHNPVLGSLVYLIE